jgi:alkaline phosphatase
MDRRTWLKLGAMAGAAAATHAALPHRLGASAALPVGAGPRSPVRNIIFLAYDGTGYEDFATADFAAREILGQTLHYRRLLSAGASGVMMPSSLTSWVTDSAAASTAWSTGRKVVNGALAIYPDGRELTTILELARARGKATGLVTTARSTHATPAGWVAKVASRDFEQEIALQYLASGTDVILGGGAAPYDPAVREDGRDLFQEFGAAGYEVVRTKEALAASTGSRLLGVFTPGTQHVAYEVDRRFGRDPSPSLAEMTRIALERLDGAAQGFVLQIEAGRPDHANHQNDAGALFWDWIAADEALGEVLKFVEGRDDTLLIHAPDHDTGGGVTFGWGSQYSRSDPSLLTLANRKASHEFLIREVFSQTPSAAEVEAVCAEYLGIPVEAPVSAELAAILSGDRSGIRWGHQNAVSGDTLIQFSQRLSHSPRNQADRPAISYATSNHTAGFVPVVLYGAGAEPGNLGMVDNTELFNVMTAALGEDFQNPEMTAEEARRVTEGG